MLKTRHIGAYRDLLVLFTRYGRRDFRLNLSPDELVLPVDDEAPIEPDVRQRAEAFAAALKKMGPTYVKFGQLLSTRPDIVPPEYITALESLQDHLEPFSFADVERIVEEELKVEDLEDLRGIRVDADRRRVPRPGPSRRAARRPRGRRQGAAAERARTGQEGSRSSSPRSRRRSKRTPRSAAR